MELENLYGSANDPMALLHRRLVHMVQDVIGDDQFLRDLVN